MFHVCFCCCFLGYLHTNVLSQAGRAIQLRDSKHSRNNLESSKYVETGSVCGFCQVVVLADASKHSFSNSVLLDHKSATYTSGSHVKATGQGHGVWSKLIE